MIADMEALLLIGGIRMAVRLEERLRVEHNPQSGVAASTVFRRNK